MKTDEKSNALKIALPITQSNKGKKKSV